MRTVAVLDQYGYVSLMTREEYKALYDKFPSDYRPNTRTFSSEEALKYQYNQNEYTRNRINEGI